MIMRNRFLLAAFLMIGLILIFFLVTSIPDDRRDSTNTKGNFVFDRVCRYNLRGRPVVS